MGKQDNNCYNITAKLKKCEPEIRYYITALKRENLKLQKQIAKHQAQNTSLQNRIKVLEKEQYRPKAEVHIHGLDESYVKPAK